eukprot:1620871-Prymnesium_polylepis.1
MRIPANARDVSRGPLVAPPGLETHISTEQLPVSHDVASSLLPRALGALGVRYAHLEHLE